MKRALLFFILGCQMLMAQDSFALPLKSAQTTPKHTVKSKPSAISSSPKISSLPKLPQHVLKQVKPTYVIGAAKSASAERDRKGSVALGGAASSAKGLASISGNGVHQKR